MSKSILSNEKKCFICGKPYELHKHHIFYGGNRWKSEREGCWCYLCVRHHVQTNVAVHVNHQMDLDLKQICERAWIEKNESDIEGFRKVFGKNYL